MWFEEFALERWALDPRVAAARHDLASSAGRPWTLRELLELVAPSGEAEAVLDERLGYSSVQGRRELRQAVAHLYGADPESVRITCGASQALFLQIALAARPGANAVLPAPGYPAYRGLAKGFGLEVREIPLSRERGFVLDAEAVISHLDGDTPLVILTTPHNPTGSCLDRPTLEAIAAATADRGIPLVVDEVFHPIRHDGGSEESAAAIEDVIVIGDLSKALSLPGLRIGWQLDRDPERRQRADDLRGYVALTGAPHLEALAALALARRDAILSRTRAAASANLEALAAFLERLGDRLAWVRPTGGLLAFPWLTSGESTRPLCESLMARGLVVVPGDCFGAPEHLRIGFGANSPHAFAAALAELEEALAPIEV